MQVNNKPNLEPNLNATYLGLFKSNFRAGTYVPLGLFFGTGHPGPYFLAKQVNERKNPSRTLENLVAYGGFSAGALAPVALGVLGCLALYQFTK